MKNQKKLTTFLKRLGLKNKEALIYNTFIEKGPLATSQIEKYTDIPRTSIYRYVKNLKTLGLAETIIDEYKTKYQATIPEQFEVLIKQKESTVNYLKKNYPQIAQQIAVATQHIDPTTKVKFYRSKKGIRQMLWNILQAKRVYGYTYRRVKEVVGRNFITLFANECKKRGLIIKDLYSDSFLESAGKKRLKDVIHADFCRSRYIPSDILDIQLQTDIYKDVVAIYNWHEGEVFGIEIYNKKNARFQKQIFGILWRLSSRYKRNKET